MMSAALVCNSEVLAKSIEISFHMKQISFVTAQNLQSIKTFVLELPNQVSISRAAALFSY